MQTLLLDIEEIQDTGTGVSVYKATIRPNSTIDTVCDLTKYHAVGDSPVMAVYELFARLSEDEDTAA